MPTLVAALASLHAKPERAEALEAKLLSFVAPTRAEAGCISYDVHRDARDSNVFVMYEVWSSEEALAAHHAQPHMIEFFAQRMDYLSREFELTPLLMKSTPSAQRTS